MNTILNSLSEADKNKSFLTIYKDGADFDIKLSDFTSAISAGSLKLLNGINLSASLTEVTDVIGTISPLQLSTTQVNVGGGTSLGRLVVKGDGTNPVARFENSSGANGWYFSASGSSLNSDSQFRIQGPAIANDSSIVLGSYNQLSTTSGIQTIATVQSNIGCALGSGNKRVFSTEYTINNSGVQTGVATGIFLNATETALNGMTHNLMDLQVGGVSQFKIVGSGTSGYIDYKGYLTLGNPNIYLSGFILISAPSSNILKLTNLAGNDFNRLQLGGTTSSFPSIKRNGAAIDLRLADDSGFTTLNCGNISAINGGVIGGNGGVALGFTYVGAEVANNGFYGWSSTITVSGTMDTNLSRISAGLVGVGTGTTSNSLGGIQAGNISLGATLVASAILQADSTTKGFLMPRMTTAQKNAIVTPATGLMVFDTDLGKLCVFSTTWQTVTSV